MSDEGRNRPELSDEVRNLHSEDSPEVSATLTCRQVKENMAAPQPRSWTKGDIAGKYVSSKVATIRGGAEPRLREGVEEGGWEEVR